MKSVVFTLALGLAACATHPAPSGQPSATIAPTFSSKESADQGAFLLAAAAQDFHDHPAQYPARLRNVRFGHAATSSGGRQYVLCGEFLPANEGGATNWVRFATVRTDPYEQWIGGGAATYCEGRPMVWEGGDLSAALQSRLDSLR